MVEEIGEELVIELDKKEFKKGESVIGRVFVRMSKPMIAHDLSVKFFGLKTIVNKEGVPIQQDAKEEKLFKVKKELDGEKLYSNADYFFSLEIPADLNTQPVSDTFIPKLMEQIRSYLGQKTILEWFVEATLKISEEDRVDRREKIIIT